MPEQPCAFHPTRQTGVRCTRCERPICPDDMVSAPVGFLCPVCAGQMREGALGHAEYRVRARAERMPLLRQLAGAEMTSIIIGANVLVYALMVLTGAPTSGRTLYNFGALPGMLAASQWWRLVTATFVHIGLLHILFNMFALMLFGGAIEHRYGKMRFLALYLGSGVLGSACSLAFSNAMLSAGASGAIYGIFGAWLALAIRHRATPEMRGQLRSWVFLIGINLMFSRATPGIDLWAHVGGLVGGFAIAFSMELVTNVKGRARLPLSSIGYVAVAVASYFLVSANVLRS